MLYLFLITFKASHDMEMNENLIIHSTNTPFYITIVICIIWFDTLVTSSHPVVYLVCYVSDIIAFCCISGLLR